ncbi:MAG: tRNA (guanine(46)-N(7))-methyltransferase, partial [uncultured Sphingomonadaceae bacterium]
PATSTGARARRATSSRVPTTGRRRATSARRERRDTKSGISATVGH